MSAKILDPNRIVSTDPQKGFEPSLTTRITASIPYKTEPNRGCLRVFMILDTHLSMFCDVADLSRSDGIEEYSLCCCRPRNRPQNKNCFNPGLRCET